MLIMKNIRVSEKVARDIFYKSTKLEELLNEEINMT